MREGKQDERRMASAARDGERQRAQENAVQVAGWISTLVSRCFSFNAAVFSFFCCSFNRFASFFSAAFAAWSAFLAAFFSSAATVRAESVSLFFFVLLAFRLLPLLLLDFLLLLLLAPLPLLERFLGAEAEEEDEDSEESEEEEGEEEDEACSAREAEEEVERKR